MEEATHSLETASAVLSYRRGGSGPAVLFIQGVGVIGEGWRPQCDGLCDRYTTIVFDNRGLGASTLGSESLTIEAMAADALAIMDAEKIDRFHLAGHSMGGLIAQEVALRAPVMPPALLAERDRAQLAETLRPLFGRDLAEQPPIIVKQLRAMAKYDASGRLGQLAPVPTLVVSAELDRIALPAFGRELAAAIPGARLVELPGAGHGVPIHSAETINGLLAEHFASAQ